MSKLIPKYRVSLIFVTVCLENLNKGSGDHEAVLDNSPIENNIQTYICSALEQVTLVQMRHFDSQYMTSYYCPIVTYAQTLFLEIYFKREPCTLLLNVDQY